MASSQRRARCSKEAWRGFPSGCCATGRNHSSSTGSVARTYAAASRCPTWGGSKLPPKSAISMSGDYLVSVEEEGRAPALEIGALRIPGSAQLADRAAGFDARPEFAASGEQVDGWDLLDELVLLGAPAEARWILRAGVDDARHAGAHWLELARIGDVELHAAAARAGVLVPGGRERARAEQDARQLLRRERVREAAAVQPWRAPQLERPGRASRFGEIGSFQQTHARIDQSGVGSGHVRRGHHPRQPRIGVEHVAAPALQLDHLQVAADPESVLRLGRVEQLRV